MYTLVLTELETACGVTLDQVQRTLQRGAFNGTGDRFMVDADTPPALAGATARAAFAGPVEYAGHNSIGLPVYRRA